MGAFDILTQIAPSLIKGAGDIYGAISSSKANTKAAKKLAEAEQQKVALQNQVYGDLQEQAAPAVNYFRSIVASPGGLTPDQEAERADLERQTLNQVNHTGLRGSGRAVTSALRRVDSDYVNSAMAQNRQNKMAAAGQLGGQYFSAADNLARGEGDAIESSASAGAQAGINNASLRGQAIGDIGGLIASEIKGRDSAYADPVEKIKEAFGLRDTQPAI